MKSDHNSALFHLNEKLGHFSNPVLIVFYQLWFFFRLCFCRWNPVDPVCVLCLWGCIWLDRNIERQYGKHMGIYNSWCLGDVILRISVILELSHYACCFSRVPLIKHTQTEMKKASGWCWEVESKQQIKKKWRNRGEKGSGGILLFAG